MTNTTKKQRRIVCSALKHSRTGQLLLSPRHFDQHTHAQIRQGIEQGIWVEKHWIDAKQGFVDQYGTWCDRKEAYLIAVEANQIVYPDTPGPTGVLFSEHLY